LQPNKRREVSTDTNRKSARQNRAYRIELHVVWLRVMDS